ncbi:MAG: hypothetical protein K0B02_03530 [DPANN group archaeon]|nr:hypothetical protein [DPANN group archaeon]
MKTEISGYEEAFNKMLWNHLPTIYEEYETHKDIIDQLFETLQIDNPLIYHHKIDFKNYLKNDWNNIDLKWYGTPKDEQFLNLNSIQNRILIESFKYLTDQNVVAFIYDPAQLDEIEKPIFPFTDTKKVIRNALSDELYRDTIEDLFDRYGPITIVRDIRESNSEDTTKPKEFYRLKNQDNKIIGEDNLVSDLLNELTITHSNAKSSFVIPYITFMGTFGALGFSMLNVNLVENTPLYFEDIINTTNIINGFAISTLLGLASCSIPYGFENTIDTLKESNQRIGIKNKVKKDTNNIKTKETLKYTF